MWQTKHHKFFHIFVKPVIRPFIYIKNNFPGEADKTSPGIL